MIGRTLRVGGIPQTVVGILPQGFGFPHMSEIATAVWQRTFCPYEIFKPLLPDMTDSGNYNYLVVGRLRPGVTLAQTQSELGGLQHAYARTIAGMRADAGVLVEPLTQEEMSPFRSTPFPFTQESGPTRFRLKPRLFDPDF